VLEPTSKSLPHVQKNEGGRKKNFFEGEEFMTPAEERRTTASRPPAAACSLIDCWLCPLFFQFFNLFLFYFWRYKE
jgi:hypothetical protein